MTVRKRGSTRFLYFVVLWCVFSFKVLLGGMGEAGLRVDDLLIFAAFGILVLRGDLVRVPRSDAFRAYLIFVCVNFCSAVWNGGWGRVDFVYSTLFAVRLLQYTVFYYLGYALIESGIRVWRGLSIYFYVLCVVVPLQVIRVIPTASRFDASRASGNANGPYELASIAAFFLCYFGYQERKKISAVFAFLMLVLTASRITFVGAIMGFVVRSVSSSKSKLKAGLIGATVLLALWGGGTWISSASSADEDSVSLSSRLRSASTLISIDEIKTLFDAIPTYRTSEDYTQGAYIGAIEFGSESESDASGMIRVFRWAALLKATTTSFDSILIGLGPSFGSAAVDGYFVRVFVETGLVGLISFVWFLRALTKRREPSGAFREFVMILIVTACFIDIFASYKTMILLWLWHGMNESNARQRQDASSLPNAG